MREGVDDIPVAGQDGIDDREVGHRIDAQARIVLAQRGQPVELHTEDEGQGVAQDEDRDGDAEERDRGHDAVDPAVGVAGGQPAQGDPQADREDQGPNRQLHGGREAYQERARDLSAIDEARAEVAMQQAAEVGDVLNVEGFV